MGEGGRELRSGTPSGKREGSSARHTSQKRKERFRRKSEGRSPLNRRKRGERRRHTSDLGDPIEWLVEKENYKVKPRESKGIKKKARGQNAGVGGKRCLTKNQETRLWGVGRGKERQKED